MLGTTDLGPDTKTIVWTGCFNFSLKPPMYFKRKTPSPPTLALQAFDFSVPFLSHSKMTKLHYPNCCVLQTGLPRHPAGMMTWEKVTLGHWNSSISWIWVVVTKGHRYVKIQSPTLKFNTLYVAIPQWSKNQTNNNKKPEEQSITCQEHQELNSQFVLNPTRPSKETI